MACDYDFQEMAFDYATLTRPGSPHIIPGIPAPALLPIPAQIGVACPGQPPLTLWAYAVTAPPHRPGRYKIPDVVQRLPNPENVL